tara:strand:+ start:149 stop:1927 length:1779 start_codon:yes stop_codon:yes gene_type:complete
MINISSKLNNFINNNIALNLIKIQNKKKDIIFLLFLFISNSFFEGLTVLSIFPFLSMLTDTDNFYQREIVFLIANFFGIKNSSGLILPITILFIFFILVSLLFKLISFWKTAHISAKIQIDFSRLLFRKNLYQTYINYTKADSSKMITASTTYSIAGGKIINAFLDIIAASIMSLFIFIALIIFNWKISIILILSIGFIYIIISYFIKKKLYTLGLQTAKSDRYSIKTLQEGFGGFRDVLLNSAQEIFINNLTIHQKISKFNSAKTNFYSIFPRYFIESLALIIMSLIAFIYINSLDSKTYFILPTLGTYALAFQKLLPLTQQIFNNWTIYNFRIPVGKILLDELNHKNELEIPVRKISQRNIKESIKCKNVAFKYQKKQKIYNLKDINLTIKKGEHIGILGSSGSGKSTLLDLIMGLLKPTAGKILIDEIDLHNQNNPNLVFNWRKSIAHVPQNIFLMEGTIAQNITFGLDESSINFSKIVKSAEKANLLEFVSNTKNGFETLVGERGVQISGGQRQRIGIARALYNECSILILDEATNALDIKTEQNILKTLNKLKGEVTIITVTHKTNQSEFYDRLFEISNGSLIEINK